MKSSVIAIGGCSATLALGGDAPRGCWMTRLERRQCASLDTVERRADFRASRLAAKRAALRVLHDDRAPAALPHGADALRRIAVLRCEGGSPAVVVQGDAGQWLPFAGPLSLAHRDGRGVAAAGSPGARIGVDLERAGSVSPCHRHFFASDEELAHGPDDVTSLWVLKEAAWKALKLDVSRPLRCLELEFDAGRELRAVHVGNRRSGANATVLHPGLGYVAALVLVEVA